MALLIREVGSQSPGPGDGKGGESVQREGRSPRCHCSSAVLGLAVSHRLQACAKADSESASAL